jgi:hypothetical protein
MTHDSVNFCIKYYLLIKSCGGKTRVVKTKVEVHAEEFFKSAEPARQQARTKNAQILMILLLVTKSKIACFLIYIL